jgi:hypothetical protein
MSRNEEKIKQRGQSLVELAFMLPLLIMLLLGMVEVVNIGRVYLALLDTTYLGAHLGSQGEARYNDAKINTLVTQDLTDKGLTTGLIDVIITRADLPGGAVIQNLSSDHMRSPGRASRLTAALLTSRLNGSDPKGKLVAVEIVYDYDLLFPWPDLAGILPDPFPLVTYTIQYAPR